MLSIARRARARLWATAMLCAVSPAQAATDASPDAPTPARLADPSRDAATVSLRAILAYADEHAPALRRARSERAIAQAEVAAASVGWDDPEIEASAGPKLGHGRRSGVELELTVRQPIEIPGLQRLRIEAARARHDEEALEYEGARWAVHRVVHEAFHAALVARERCLVARRVLTFATHLGDITRRQLEAGAVSNVEVRLAAGQLAQARQALVAAEGVARLARIRLAEVSGWSTSDPPQVAGRLDMPRRPPALETLLRRAEAHNPQLRRHAQAVIAARADVATAERRAWPQPTVGLAYGHEREPGGERGSHVGLVSVGMSLPLWNRNHAQRARAAARVEAVDGRREAAARQVSAALARAHCAVEVAAKRIAAFGDEVIPAFGGNLALLERAYELGEIDLLQVMVARGRFLDVEREALSAYDEYFASIAQLEALLGTEVWADEHHDDDGAREGAPMSRLGQIMALAAGAAIGCSEWQVGHDGHDGRDGRDGHGEHDHGRGGESSGETLDLDRPVAQLFAASCEHGIKTHTCEECRYEVGVVRAPRSLFDGGLLHTAKPVRGPLGTALQLTGEVQFDQRRVAHVSTQAEGIIREVYVNLGDSVTRGARLLEIESVAVGEAQAAYLEARGMLELAQRTTQRKAALHKEGISSEKNLLEAAQGLDLARIRAETALGTLVRLGMSETSARDLSRGAARGRLVLRSPTSGLVLQTHAVAGEVAGSEVALVTVGDNSAVWVWADLYERDIASVSRHQKQRPLAATVTVKAFADRLFAGTVDFISPTMSETSRTVKVRIAVPNPSGELLAGMFAAVRLILPGDENRLTVPRCGVLADEGRSFVFVHHRDDYYVRRPVAVGRTVDDAVEIRTGLSGDETVVTDGAFLMKSDVLRSKMGAGCAD